jgi:hypothetical protein
VRDREKKQRERDRETDKPEKTKRRRGKERSRGRKEERDRGGDRGGGGRKDIEGRDARETDMRDKRRAERQKDTVIHFTYCWSVSRDKSLSLPIFMKTCQT